MIDSNDVVNWVNDFSMLFYLICAKDLKERLETFSFQRRINEVHSDNSKQEHIRENTQIIMREDNQGGHYKYEIEINQRHDQDVKDPDDHQLAPKAASINNTSTTTSDAPNTTTTNAQSTISTTNIVNTVSILH